MKCLDQRQSSCLPEYLDHYFRRVTHMGDTPQEIASNSAQNEFDSYLQTSPNSVPLSIYNTSIRFRGIILTHKQDPNRLSKILKTQLKIPIEPGTIVCWGPEKWIVYQQERRAFEPFNVSLMVRCNYQVKWVDREGFVQSSYAHVVSSKDSKVKENFRTWNKLITPQPNKNAEILIPAQPIDRYTNFIIEDEAWYVIELDKTSVPGIVYLALGEGKVNMINDDLVNDIADADRIAKFSMEIPSEPLTIQSNTIFKPVFTVYKDGKTITDLVDVHYEVSGNIEYENGVFTTGENGEGTIKISVPIYDLEAEQKIIISGEENIAAIISGNDTIKLDRTGTYYLEGIQITGGLVCEINDNVLAYVVGVQDNYCVIKANDKNKLGTITLTMTYAGISYTKEISVVPLW